MATLLGLHIYFEMFAVGLEKIEVIIGHIWAGVVITAFFNPFNIFSFFDEF